MKASDNCFDVKFIQLEIDLLRTFESIVTEHSS